MRHSIGWAIGPRSDPGAGAPAQLTEDDLATLLRVRDANTRRLAPQRLSRPSHSSALATLRRRPYRTLRSFRQAGGNLGGYRRVAKKRTRRSAHSSARTPATVSNSWF